MITGSFPATAQIQFWFSRFWTSFTACLLVNLPEPYPKPAKTNRSPLTLAQPLHSMEFCKMHGATFWERHRAGNFCLDSGQLLQGIYAFCRKKPCTACVQNCISKMHVQNCIKGASLEAMEAPIESKSCVHSRLSSKKKKIWYPTVPVWWIWEQFTEK